MAKWTVDFKWVQRTLRSLVCCDNLTCTWLIEIISSLKRVYIGFACYLIHLNSQQNMFKLSFLFKLVLSKKHWLVHRCLRWPCFFPIHSIFLLCEWDNNLAGETVNSWQFDSLLQFSFLLLVLMISWGNGTCLIFVCLFVVVFYSHTSFYKITNKTIFIPFLYFR